MAVFKKTTITNSVDTGPASSRTDATKTWFTNVVTDLEAGIFASLSDTYPVLHWDSTRKAYSWGSGGASAADLFLQRFSLNGLELKNAANNAWRDMKVRRLMLSTNTTAPTPTAGFGDLYSAASRLRIQHPDGEIGWLEERPYCRANHDSDEDFANTTWAAVTFDSESEDLWGMHSTAAATARITIPSDLGGVYMFGAHIKWNNVGTAAHNLFGIRLVLNGTVVALNQEQNYGNGAPALSIQTIVRCVPTDYMTVQVYQATGDTLATDYVAGSSPIFWAVQLGK
jgi:hypothetical protein